MLRSVAYRKWVVSGRYSDADLTGGYLSRLGGVPIPQVRRRSRQLVVSPLRDDRFGHRALDLGEHRLDFLEAQYPRRGRRSLSRVFKKRQVE